MAMPLSPRRLTLGAALPALLACSGMPLNCGRAVHKVIPAVQEIDPVYATDPVSCDPEYPTPSVRGCVIGEITCGDKVEGNNRLGTNHFDETFYQAQKCTPERHGYSKGPEAPYLLTVPPNTWADVVLVSDCEDLDVFSANWSDPNRCPTPSHVNITQCEASTARLGGKVTITSVNREETHLVWVDGKHGAIGNFRLEVKCRLYR
jgi:hypothetical protein